MKERFLMLVEAARLAAYILAGIALIAAVAVSYAFMAAVIVWTLRLLGVAI